MVTRWWVTAVAGVSWWVYCLPAALVMTYW